MTTTAAGALFGGAVGQSKESVLVGALLGGVLGMLGVQLANADSAPQTSESARAAIDVLIRAAVAAGTPAVRTPGALGTRTRVSPILPGKRARKTPR